MSPVDFGRRELSTVLDTLESPLHFLDVGTGPHLGGGLELTRSSTKSCFGSAECCDVGSLGRLLHRSQLAADGRLLPDKVSVPVRWFRRIERVSVRHLPQSFGTVAGATRRKGHFGGPTGEYFGSPGLN